MVTWIPWVLLAIVTPLCLTYRSVARARGNALARELLYLMNTNDVEGIGRLHQFLEQAYKARWITRWIVRTGSR